MSLKIGQKLRTNSEQAEAELINSVLLKNVNSRTNGFLTSRGASSVNFQTYWQIQNVLHTLLANKA